MLSRSRLPLKIGLGFGFLLLISVAVGAFSIWKMTGVRSLQEDMDRAHVQKVSAVTAVERHWSQAIFELRGYGMTGELALLQSGRAGLASVKEDLELCLLLAEGHGGLSQLGDQAKKGLVLLAEYEDLIVRTKDAQDQMRDYGEIMDSTQSQFFTDTFQLLREENQTLSLEIAAATAPDKITSHQARVILLERVIELGSQAWLARYGLHKSADAATVEEIQKTLADMRGSFDELVSMSRKEALLQQRLAMLRSTAEQFKSLLGAWLEQWCALKELREKREALDATMTALAQTESDVGLQGIKAASGEAIQSLMSSSRHVLQGVGLAVLVGLALTFFLSRHLTRPIKAAVIDLNQGAMQVAEAALQISRASQLQAEGSSQQVSSLEESSAALDQITAMTKNNSDHARKATQLVKLTVSSARQAREAMGRLSNAMRSIQEATRRTESIVRMIEGIAFQTNLLALNAAVEAARAGHAGAGFAVVADQVRSLAIRTSQAARQTADLIGRTLGTVAEGNRISQEVSVTFEDVNRSSQEAGGLMDRISVASSEQAQGMSQINRAVTEIDSITQNQASSTEQTAAAAEELSRQSERMREVVDRLRALVAGDGQQAANSKPTALPIVLTQTDLD